MRVGVCALIIIITIRLIASFERKPAPLGTTKPNSSSSKHTLTIDKHGVVVGADRELRPVCGPTGG